MIPPPESRCLGEYLLKQLRSEDERIRTWLAAQQSITREVLVDELRAECLEQKGEFLADVRAKAAVDHPLIGSVYEAVDAPEHCFSVRELLRGESLEKIIQAQETLLPSEIAPMLCQIAVSQQYLESLRCASSPLEAENIYLDTNGVVRIDNLAVAGTRAPEESARDISRLGHTLWPLVAEGQPGTTRTLTLFSWMRGEELESPLDWHQVADIAGQIEQQLAAPAPEVTASPLRKKRKNKPFFWLAAAVVTLLIVAAALFSQSGRNNPAAPNRAELPAPVEIPAGMHPTPDGAEQELRAFRISSHEVTIGQYAEFLETLETLTKEKLERTYDHAQQPAEKTSHVPDDWSTLHAAAKSSERWNQHAVTLDTPVVGVDWWDAAAFAAWKKARLPSQEEWFAALRRELPEPAKLTPSAWLPVSKDSLDRTPLGMLGMAGSVSEWASQPALNPSNPLGERNWVIIGGSFEKPGSNALSREWTPDRSLRRADLGFRILWDVE